MLRRQFLLAPITAATSSAGLLFAEPKGANQMYGMIGKISATPGHRGELISLLGSGTRAMPGCLSYVISEDADDADAMWVSEYWDSKASHDASLSLPIVKDTIAKCKPMIAGFAKVAELKPVTGVS